MRFEKSLVRAFGMMSLYESLWARPLVAVAVAFLGAAVSFAPPTALGNNCPFCSAVSQTFSEEMATMDVVVFAELVKAAAPPADLRDASTITQAEFRIVEVLKGKELAQVGATLRTIYLGDAQPGDRFLVQGVRPPDIAWSTPMRVTERGMRYLASLESVPDDGAERLEFFLQFLEDDDEMLARDAYDEFARAPYEDVIALKPAMEREKLLTWVLDSEISASRKRLYYTLLGVCGKPDDLATLERLMRSNDRQEKAGLDALIACYLTLRGNEGLGLIEELFLANHEADYSDTYSAITALRFHGTDGNVLDRALIVKSLELMLDRPALADLVIPDLARWEDWSVMDRLVDMFKNADEKTSWIRVPVINYLRACPLPEAKAKLEELAKIDPDAIRRANTFFPVLDESDLDDESEPGSDGGNEPPKEGGDGGIEQTRNLRPLFETAATLAAFGPIPKSIDSSLMLVTVPSSNTSWLAETGDVERVSQELPTSSPVNSASRQDIASDANLPSSNSVAILGAWSDSPRFVAAQQAPDRISAARQPSNVLVASKPQPNSIWVVGLLSIALLSLALLTQWYVLTGRLAKFVN